MTKKEDLNCHFFPGVLPSPQVLCETSQGYSLTASINNCSSRILAAYDQVPETQQAYHHVTTDVPATDARIELDSIRRVGSWCVTMQHFGMFTIYVSYHVTMRACVSYCELAISQLVPLLVKRRKTQQELMLTFIPHTIYPTYQGGT